MSVKQKEQFLQALADVNNSASAVFSKAEAMQIAKSNGLKNNAVAHVLSIRDFKLYFYL